MMKRVSDFFSDLSSTLKSILKIALLSRKNEAIEKSVKECDDIIVLGNGPSLKETFAEHFDRIKLKPTLAVNFMANTPEFEEIKPDYYVIADPHFFTGLEQENVESLWRRLANVEWPIVVCVPRKKVKKARRLLGKNKNVTVKGFNFVGLEGFAWFEKMVFNKNFGMPRPRNVLIPALMTAIEAGYKNIYVAGADHSWLETIRVTDDNHVVSVQPHFYKDSSRELKRSEVEYRGYRLHDILLSFYVAFRSYHRLERYAGKMGINIYNSTPGSYIDAFRRRQL